MSTNTMMINRNEQALLSLMDNTLEAFNTMDLEKLLSLHSDNVILMEPNMPAIEGKDKIRQLFNKMQKKNIDLELAYFIDEVKVSGTLGFVRGQVIKTTIENGIADEPHAGKFICICQKQSNRQWVRTHVIVNSDDADVNWSEKIR